MSLAATLAAGGLRPASSLPTIKCSNCGDEIEISAMGEHICAKAPPSPKSQPASLNNPFTLRQLNATNSKPAQPSPLQFDNPPPQTRPRAPTAGSMTSSRLPRGNLPRINPDAANRPFLAPVQRPESPISPAASSRSGSSNGGKPMPPQRSMTSPMPRLWDPRPPSPELSANLDCAFPPFPFGDSTPSRPGSSNGRDTPSDRGSSRAGSRQDGRLPDPSNVEPRSPTTSSRAGENVMNRMNTLKSGPFDPAMRRPSREDAAQSDDRPLDRRRPSVPNLPAADEPPPLPPMPSFDSPSVGRPAGSDVGQNSLPKSLDIGNRNVSDSKGPPPRPARPTEPLSPGLLNNMTGEAKPPMAPDFPLPPQPLQPTAPRNKDEQDDMPPFPSLTKVPSEPALRARSPRPAMPEPSHSEPAPVFPARSTSRGGAARMDWRLEDAPPVPRPVQIQRSNSLHRPSGSGSSTASSNRSLENSNSSLGASPVTSAASSVDAFSPLSNEAGNSFGGDRGMRPAGLNIRPHDNPGMRAEMPRQKKSPPRNFARPVAPAPPPPPPPPPPPAPAPAPPAIPEPPLESPVLPTGNWPLESPMDPGLQNGILAVVPEQPSPSVPAPEPPKTLTPGFGLSPADFLSDDYDPYKPPSPRFPPPQQQQQQQRQQQQQFHTRARSKTNNERPTRAFSPAPSLPSRSQTPQLTRAQTSNTDPIPRALQPFQPPPIPQDSQPIRPGLSRRPTVSGAKQTCRGCGLPIEGKSVKAADGRLTGRWHKQCFTCKTCEQPFTSADFYVLANHPYCEQHYHEKNGSTCAGCRRGIEGEYLETSSVVAPGARPGPAGGAGARVERKFHPRCFTCFNCRVVLSEDYFEIGGRVFCERHALAAVSAQPRPAMVMGPGGLAPPPRGASGGALAGLMPHGASGLKAERRTTRLMMM